MTERRPDITDNGREVRRGILYGLSAYFIWGFFPLFFRLLSHVPPLQVLAHRISWSLLTLLFFLSAAGGWRRIRQALTDGKILLILSATTLLIATNWFVFILAVDHGQVLQSSFGYFINPLVSVLLGFVFLRERLRPLQLISVAAAILGVVVLTLHHGALPWMALVLAITFGLYGLLRKVVPVDSLTGLFVETILLFPVACGYLLYLAAEGRGAFLAGSAVTSLLLGLAGVITAIPLLWFAASARRLRLSTVGFMQYITPTIHFLLAVLVFDEPFDTTHLVSFGCIWAGLALYSWDAARGAISAARER